MADLKTPKQPRERFAPVLGVAVLGMAIIGIGLNNTWESNPFSVKALSLAVLSLGQGAITWGMIRSEGRPRLALAALLTGLACAALITFLGPAFVPVPLLIVLPMLFVTAAKARPGGPKPG